MNRAIPSVLVVEDDASINALVGAYVRLCGYEYRPAFNGETALAEAEARPPTAVTLDLMMPGMDGFEVCRRLREMPQTADTPIIIVSAMSDDQSRERTRRCGANRHLVKPFDPDQFLEVLKDAVAKAP